MTINKGLFTSNKDDWETPQDLFDKLNKKYKFSWDLAASSENHKVNNYFSEEDNSLVKPWHSLGGALWLNLPYGRKIGLWVKKAYEESLETDSPIVLLIPARTDTSYWHDYIFGKAHIKFIRGRIKFERNGVPKDAAPFPSAIVVYNYRENN